jgi:hypothetical protein
MEPVHIYTLKANNGQLENKDTVRINYEYQHIEML